MHVVRKPKLTEVTQIEALLNLEARRGSVLPRELTELYENCRDFYTYVDELGVGACCALHIDMLNLAEIRSLVVRDDLRGKGVASGLIAACISEAQKLEIAQVYALTRIPKFFENLGFRNVDKDSLPTKVYKDCLRCPKYHCCDETALVIDCEKYVVQAS